MIEEFRQAPLRLELDLDSYEGPWTHVARFRGRSGWLIGAEATLESSTDIFRASIVAACDECDNPIPSFQAQHLMECLWTTLEPCDELPPEVLDDLLCEEEGRVYSRWQRETNDALRQHLILTDEKIAAAEAAVRLANNRIMRQISDLRRRRRMLDLSPDDRSILDALIADLEADNDRQFEHGRQLVAELRAALEIDEEQFWQREDVVIEVAPVCVVAWHARATKAHWQPARSFVARAAPDAVRTRLRYQIPARIESLQHQVDGLLTQRNRGKEAYQLDREMLRLRTMLKEVRT